MGDELEPRIIDRPIRDVQRDLEQNARMKIWDTVQPIMVVDDTDQGVMGGGPILRPLLITPSAGTAPSRVLPGQVYDPTLGRSDPLTYSRRVALCGPEMSSQSVLLPGSADPSPWIPFSAALTADGAGALTGSPLGAAGAGLKWEIGWVTVDFQAHASAVLDQALSDTVGLVPRGQTYLGKVQGTANTAITLASSASCAIASSKGIIAGIARKVA